MYVTPAARLAYWKADIAKQEKFLFDNARLLVSRGDVVWDVGSNNGVFAVAAAACAGRDGEVLAFEPDAWLGSLVRRTAAGLGDAYASIDVLNVAVSDRMGLAEFAIASRSRAANFLVEAGGSSVSGGVRDKYRVLTVGLDDVLRFAPPPRVIKIDIEWAEHLALRGASRMLTEIRPRILCEVAHKNGGEVTEILTSAGYWMFDAERPAANPCRTSTAVANTLFVPSEDELAKELDDRIRQQCR
jgi:FkbM family methyltransferase